MAKIIEVKVPDIGDFKDVDIIEVAVKPGDRIGVEEPLITLESDKATMDVPSPYAGIVKEVKVSAGDKVSEGSPIASVETQETLEESPSLTPEKTAEVPSGQPSGQTDEIAASTSSAEITTQLVVLGAGPGGYTAAFRAADLGLRTVLVERYPTLGGVCLNVGCIPSKALLHAAEVISGAEEMRRHGIAFEAMRIEPGKVATWKDGIVRRLTRGLAGLAKQRQVQVIQGAGRFTSPQRMTVETSEGEVSIRFEQAIIAAGSQATKLPSFPNEDARIWDSTDALRLDTIPQRLLIIGGGIIGLEMATVFDAFGSKVTVVELLDSLLPGVDPDLVRPLQKRITKRYEKIFVNTRVTGIEPREENLRVSFEGPGAPASDNFDSVLVAVGRTPNGKLVGAEAAGVEVDKAGFVAVNAQQRTNVPHIFAIGDIVGQPMLAHKATHEGKAAAEVAAGLKSAFDAKTIPSVAYTNPEVAWTGLTETEAKQRGIAFEKGMFPWAASGRALGMARDDGLTKLLFDKETRRIIGAGIVGPHAGDLIAETVVAMEMGADAQDLGLSIHPHPTLAETVSFAAEMVEGTITDLYLPRKS
ncbi:MAG: dihydrolipoyl dehydrogenase [Gammaproteobacteria bacterium]|jgi:dihydrolipoamide dehydrogenase